MGWWSSNTQVREAYIGQTVSPSNLVSIYLMKSTSVADQNDVKQ